MISSIARISAVVTLTIAILFSLTSMASSAEDLDSKNPSPEAVEVVSGDEFEALQEGPDSAAAANACSDWKSGYAGIVWTTASAKDCNIFGYPGYKKTYSFYVPYWSGGRACAQGRGYTSTGATQWLSIGCGKSGSWNVPWNNYVSYPSYKAKSLSLPFGTPTFWR